MGDNSSWWEHLELAMPQLMNMGLSGVPFVGTDIGGFNGNASGELFARWMQFGALAPFCRSHSMIGTEHHEPWAFGSRIEDICRECLVRLVDRRTDHRTVASTRIRAARAHAALRPRGSDHPQRTRPALRRRAPGRPADAGPLFRQWGVHALRR